MKSFALLIVVLFFGWGAMTPLSQADTHIYLGARGTQSGDPCIFSNGRLFDATLSSFALPQVLRTNGLNAGHYRGDALTFSALAATSENGGPVPGNAAPGARLAVQVVSVEGPPGGSFEFWEGDGESDLGKITFSVPVGTTNGTNLLVVSENHGEPGADPYGHIHGREFTTSSPGTYQIGFRVIDVSTNGIQGGPIHSPSDVLLVRFQAGVRIESLQFNPGRTLVFFRCPPGISNVLESTDSLLSPSWRSAALPIRGNNGLQSFIDTNGVVSARWYRIHQLNTLP